MLNHYVPVVTRCPGAWLIIALMLALPARADSDLRDLGNRHLPYKFLTDGTPTASRVLDGGWCQPLLITSLDGTGVVFMARNPGIVRVDEGPRFSHVRWQHTLPPEFCHREPCASLDGLWDVDGDGDLDLVLISPNADRRRWLLRALDIESGEASAEFVLAGGPERRQDGRWDGQYSVVGVADVPHSNGPRRAFLIVAEAGFDWEPRGVMAVDTRSGEILWTDFGGAKPSSNQAHCADLDGDGRPEVVYLGSAVKNLPGPVNGLGDDVCTVVAVGADGTRKWVRTLPGVIAGFLQTVTTADGVFVVAALSGAPGHPPQLLVLAGDTGAVVAASELRGTPRGLTCVDGPAGVDCYLGVDSLGIVRYHFAGELRLVAVALIRELAWVNGLGPLLPNSGLQVLATTHAGQVLVLDRDLEPLAYFTDPLQPRPPGGVAIMPVAGRDPQLRVLGREDTGGLNLVLAPNPRAIPWGALSLLPVAGGGTWYLRRRRRGASAATRRELRLQLLARLELSNHGAIGALRSLRRLVWILDALEQTEGGATELEARLQDLTGECTAHMLPELAGTLELAVLAGCDGGVTGQARSAHERIVRVLGSGGRGHEDELRAAASLLEQALVTLRHGLEDEFRADLAVVVGRVLAAHADTAADQGATVAVRGLEGPVWCRIDQDELVFVVDNLVENALRAMAASGRRELTLTVIRDQGRILLQVTDTGCGIAPDDWEAVMETRKSERKGGGLGLPESRRRLRKHGGSLAITASEAGTGTTLVMNVAPARAQERVTEH